MTPVAGLIEPGDRQGARISVDVEELVGVEQDVAEVGERLALRVGSERQIERVRPAVCKRVRSIVESPPADQARLVAGWFCCKPQLF